MLILQCFILCFIFTLAILLAQYKNPLSQFASYPAAIKKRVYELPQYKDFIDTVEHKNWIRKIGGSLFVAVILALAAYLSGKNTFSTAFFHVFILFQSVNLYDVIVFDLIIFCHSKKLMIPGTEDMIKEYRDPVHHLKGALIGLAIGTAVALVSAFFVYIISQS